MLGVEAYTRSNTDADRAQHAAPRILRMTIPLETSMNAPLDRSQLEPAQPAHEPQQEITLDDKWTLERGRAFMTGTQALIRLPT